MRAVHGVGALVCLALLATGCSGGGDPSPTQSLPSQITPTSSSSSPTSPSTPSSPPTTQVPVDQIPPGNPASWVPAGVPTTAKYAEPGDKPPMFTPAMFKHNQAGAEAMARYYISAVRWAYAVPSAAPATIICSATACTALRTVIGQYNSRQQHLRGVRGDIAQLTMLQAADKSKAEWVARMAVRYTAGALVSSSGAVVSPSDSEVLQKDIYLRWSGNLWKVVGDFESPS